MENNKQLIADDLKELSLIRDNMDRSNPPPTTLEQVAESGRRIYKKLRRQFCIFRARIVISSMSLGTH